MVADDGAPCLLDGIIRRFITGLELITCEGGHGDRLGQFLRVLTAHAKEIDDVSIQIVYGLDIRGGLFEEYRSATKEWLQVDLVLGKMGNDPVGYAPLCAGVFENRVH